MNPAFTPSDLPTGLMLVHGNQAESLRDLMVHWMRRYPLAPLESEVVLVQSNGIAQWLRLSLAADPQAGGCGIAAGLDFLLPSRFLWQAYRAVLGREAVPETSPFDKSRLQWRLMRLLPARLDTPDYAPLKRFLDHDSDLRKRFQLAERLADLYDQYQVYRADWLAAWAAGEDVLIDASGQARPLADDQRWQAALWRAVLADVGDTASGAGRASVHDAFMAAADTWRDAPRPPGLPRRVMVFGISSLPRQSLEVLAALGRWSQVLMCVQNPCEHYWADIVAGKDLLRGEAARQRKRTGAPAVLSDALLHLHAHPLLAAWGKQGRDFIALLDEHDSAEARQHYARHFDAIGQRIDLFSPPGTGHLLGQLQDDIRALRPLPETRAQWGSVDPARDTSIRFHVAHGPQREIEILHDQLLAAFNADPTLRPRDVIVMVPDIDQYAPHIKAVFGLLDAHDPRAIPFSLADQSRRHDTPLLAALALLLDLPQSRLGASQVLDLLEVPALRARFGIAESDLPLLHRWIRGANVRWALHDAHRRSLELPPDAAEAAPNTWLFGLRRMLLGYAAGDAAAPWHDIEPYGEVGGLDAAALGPLVQLLERLDTTWQALRDPAPVAGWCARFRQLMADFFTADDGDEALRLMQLDTALQRWQEATDEAALDDALPISVAAEYWLSCLDERGLSQRFFAGAVTFATLMPMRAIPFRQVCLLGMNDGDYPRTRIPMDFDLMGRDYRPGDRSRREDDRYLFLEALLSARDRLHISWVGRSIHDNTPRPPSVLVGQLRDHLAAGWRSADAATPLLDALTIEHRLQPFSRDYFPATPEASPLFTYAREWQGSAPPAPAAPATLPLMARDEPLSLRELGDFLKDPVKAFFRQRLKVRFEGDDPTSEDVEPFALDGLDTWALQAELIDAQVAAIASGQTREAACDAALARIRRRGDLPAGAFGEATASALLTPMAPLFDAYADALARWSEPVADDVEIRFELTLAGQPLAIADWLGGLRRNADGAHGRVVLENSTLIKQRKYRGDKMVHHWVSHLAGQLGGDGLTTEVISKAGSITLEPLDADTARQHLSALLGAWQHGMRRPLPLAVRTAFAWLAALPNPAAASGPDGARLLDGAATAARAVFQPGYNSAGELGESPYLQRVWSSFDALADDGEFAELAETLLRPLQRAMPVKPTERPDT